MVLFEGRIGASRGLRGVELIIGNRLNGSTPHDLALYAPLTEDEGPEPPRTCGGCERRAGILLRAGGFIRACCVDPLAMEEAVERG